MKANELMIGDWVFDEQMGIPVPVCSIREGIEYPCRPIPITPEFLEKNGFVLSKKSSRKPYQLRDNSNYVSVIKGRLNARYYEKFGKPINAMQIDCNYVHELQHALRLCGIDKEINV